MPDTVAPVCRGHIPQNLANLSLRLDLDAHSLAVPRHAGDCCQGCSLKKSIQSALSKNMAIKWLVFRGRNVVPRGSKGLAIEPKIGKSD